MVLRIILGIFPGCGASELQDARGWVEDAPGWSSGLSWGFSLDAA